MITYRIDQIEMVKGLLLALVVFLTTGYSFALADTTSSSDTSSPDDTVQTVWFQHNAVKIGPSFFGGDLTGGFLAFETTSPWETLTFQVSVKYSAGGSNPEPTSVSIPEHWRFELQCRYYPIAPMEELYFAPLVNYYNLGGMGVGALMGYQFLFGGRVPLDLSAGFQTGTKTEYSDIPIFLRLGLATGWAFPKVN